MTGYGITIPLDAPLGEHATLLRTLQDAGYTGFWTAETTRADAFTPLAYAAPAVDGATLGTAIASVYARGPAMLAMSAASLAEAAPGRFLLGLGASSPLFAAWNEVAFERPLARVRDTVRFLRAALAGERVNGMRLERPPAVTPPLLVAALRPGMLRLAGEEADGVVLNWLAADDVPTVVETAGSPAEVAARIFVCVSPDAATVRAAARPLIATYASVPAYAAFHRWLGRDAALRPMWDAPDRKAAAAAVPDQVVDALIVHGDVAECAEHVRRYVTAGVTRPIVKLLPLDPARDVFADEVALGEVLSRG